MKSFLTILTLLAAATSAHNIGKRGDLDDILDCEEPSTDFLEWSKAMEMKEAAQEGSALTERATATIKTWVHIVAASKTLSDGWVEDSHVKDQIKLLNDIYKKYEFQFSLAGITRLVDKNLAVPKEGEKIEVHGKKLRKGDYKTLNLYIVKDLPGNTAGTCSLPTNNPGTEYKFDGCRFKYTRLPGIGKGLTAVHEIGHWLGLQHTFQRGDGATCDKGDGDDIADTPVHLKPTGSECKEVDTCPKLAGKDPIHNYMNYTPETCWKEFTKGQNARMKSTWDMRITKN